MAACSKRGVIAGARKILQANIRVLTALIGRRGSGIYDPLWGLTNQTWNEATRAKGHAHENNLPQACKAYARARSLNAELKRKLRGRR